jgi:hypothetical protein
VEIFAASDNQSQMSHLGALLERGGGCISKHMKGAAKLAQQQLLKLGWQGHEEMMILVVVICKE